MKKKTELMKPAPVAQIIVPSADLPDFPESIVKVREKLAKVQAGGDLEKRVRAIAIINTSGEYRDAGKIVAELKLIDDETEDLMKEYKKIIKRVTDFIRDETNPIYDQAKVLRKEMNALMADFDVREEKARKADEERRQKEKQLLLEQEAEKQRKLDLEAAAERKRIRVNEIREDLRAGRITKAASEKLLREAGAIEEADKVQAAIAAEEGKKQAAEIASQETVASNSTTMSGVVRRVNRKFKITSAQKVKINYLCPDEVKIGQDVRVTFKDKPMSEVEHLIGGIEVWEERTY